MYSQRTQTDDGGAPLRKQRMFTMEYEIRAVSHYHDRRFYV